MSAKITAIVPTYNRARMLAESIHSILAQTRMVDEIIIWDDGSTDDTDEVAAQLGTIMAGAKNSDKVPALRYYKSENGGKSRALNLALEKAQGDYIWICDDDDLGLPHAVQTMADILDADPDLTCVGGSYRRFWVDDDSGERSELGPGYWPDLTHGTPLRHLLEDIFIFQFAMLVRKSAFDAVGPFREDLKRSVDYDMVVRLACGGPLRVIDDPLFLQRKHDGARGPATARHNANKVAGVWKNADVDVFSAFRESISLDVYEAMFTAEDPRVVRRAALLQRACVYARRTDWDTAVRDFNDAAKLAPGFRLTATEKEICKRALAGKHGCQDAYGTEVCHALRDMAALSASGGSVARAIARGTVWHGKIAVRQKNISEAFKVTRFIASLVIRSVRHGFGQRPGPVTEKDQLDPEIYRVI